MELSNLHNLAEKLRAKNAAATKSGRSWYTITNLADRTEIYFYAAVGEYGITAQDFVAELMSSASQRVDLHINSEGGQFFEGLPIYEALRQHPAHVTAHVDGLAASAASLIVQAADHRIMAKNAQMMVHDAHGLCIGNAADMRETADLLERFSDVCADIYADRAGGTPDQWRKAMKGQTKASDGTWYSAEQAVAAGLADEIAGSPKRNESKNSNKSNLVAWDAQAFRQIVEEAVA